MGTPVGLHAHVPFHNQIVLRLSPPLSSPLFSYLLPSSLKLLQSSRRSFLLVSTLLIAILLHLFIFISSMWLPFLPHYNFFPSSSDRLPSCASFKLFTALKLPLHFFSGIYVLTLHWQTSTPIPDAWTAVLPLFLPRWLSFCLFFIFLVLLQCLHSSDWLLYFSIHVITTHTIPYKTMLLPVCSLLQTAWLLQMGPVRCLEIFVNNCQHTQHKICPS